MSHSQQLNLNNSKNSLVLLVLGSGEIARTLVALAEPMHYQITVCDPALAAHDWPASVTLLNKNYNEAPFTLAAHTHAVILRGHEEDELSVVNLLNHSAEHVYLVASAKRAQSIIDYAMPLINTDALSRLSAPAGLELGGNSSQEISLSILAEIQWRQHGSTTSLQPLCDLRAARINNSVSGQRDKSCPGKRL